MIGCLRADNNDALRLLEVVSQAGESAEVVIEATYGWYRAVDVLQSEGFSVHRAKLVQLRSRLKAQVHAVMAKEGVLPGVTDMFGPKGRQLLDAMELPDAYGVRVESLRDLIEVYDREIETLERRIHELLRDACGYRAIQALDGVGRTLGAIFVTEIGDITRFRSPEALCSWGRVDAPPSWVRHEGRARQDHQTRIEARSLGRAGSDRPLPRRTTPA